MIPARMGSTRLQRKALADIEGQPMVVRVAERGAKVRGVSRVIVATDSDEILSAVKKAGFEAVMTPESLASGTERVAYVAKDLSEDVIVNLQGDEPVMNPLSVEAAMEPVLKGGRKMGSAFTSFKSYADVLLPSNVKVVTDANGEGVAVEVGLALVGVEHIDGLRAKDGFEGTHEGEHQNIFDANGGGDRREVGEGDRREHVVGDAD